MENRSKEYYYVLNAYSIPTTRFETKEALQMFLKKRKIPYADYIIYRCEKNESI